MSGNCTGALTPVRIIDAGATGKDKATGIVSGSNNPVDAAFLNGHMIRAMDYNDIYWKRPCHPTIYAGLDSGALKVLRARI